MRSPRTWPVHGHANMFLFCAPMAFQTPLSFEIPCCETPLSFKTSVLTQITPQRSPRHLRLSKSRVNAQRAFGQCFAGAGSPQKMGRWNRAVFRWNRIPAKNWGAGIRQCFAGAGSPQKTGALESGSVSLEPDPRKKLGRWIGSVALEPDPRKKLGRWNPAVFRWSRIPAKNWGAGIRHCFAGT
jgi:hypothetical protein